MKIINNENCVTYIRKRLAEITIENKYFLRSMHRMLLDAIHKYGEDDVKQACDMLQLQDYLKHLDIIGQL